jgi:ankyrin repeat protein
MHTLTQYCPPAGVSHCGVSHLHSAPIYPEKTTVSLISVSNEMNLDEKFITALPVLKNESEHNIVVIKNIERFHKKLSDQSRLQTPTEPSQPMINDSLVPDMYLCKYLCSGLLGQIADINDFTPLMSLLYSLDATQQPGCISVLKNELIKVRDNVDCQNINFDFRNINGDTALHYSIKLARPEFAETMLDVGVDIAVNIGNNYCQTPLMLAATRGYTKLVDKLINADASLDALDNNCRSALMLATRAGHHGVVESLLVAGANKQLGDRHHRTPLIRAISENRVDLVSSLVIAGAEKNSKFNTVANALPFAIRHNNGPIIAVLLQQNPDLTLRDKDGNTPFLIALRFSNLEICKALLEKGSDINAANHLGETALDIAKKGSDGRKVNWLMANGARQSHHPVQTTPVNAIGRRAVSDSAVKHVRVTVQTRLDNDYGASGAARMPSWLGNTLSLLGTSVYTAGRSLRNLIRDVN